MKSQQKNQMILSSETLIIVEQLFTDLMWNQQQNQIILNQISSETLLFVEQLFRDLMSNQQQTKINLIQETLLLIEQLFTDLL